MSQIFLSTFFANLLFSPTHITTSDNYDIKKKLYYFFEQILNIGLFLLGDHWVMSNNDQPFQWDFFRHLSNSVQFSSVPQSCPTLCDPMDWSRPGFPVYHQLLELTQTHVHRVSDAIQPSHPLSTPSPPAFNLSQYQGLLQWFCSPHQVAKVLEFQLQPQSFQWIFRTDFL